MHLQLSVEGFCLSRGNFRFGLALTPSNQKLIKQVVAEMASKGWKIEFKPVKRKLDKSDEKVMCPLMT